MSNRAVILALVAVLLALGGWWFSQNWGFAPQRVWVGYSGEARVDPYFAARLLLERLGFKVEQTADLHKLGALPPGGTVILAADRSDLDPPAARSLLTWVERDGGHLIIGVERELPRDVLLQQINVEARWPEPAEEEEEAAPPARARGIDRIPMPDGVDLRADLLPSPVLVDLDEDADAWRFSSRGGVRILQFAWGEGDITVFSTLRPFGNREIGRLDHAELLAQITDAEQPGALFLIRHLQSPSLIGWLAEHAPALLVALGVFLLAWLWRVIPRFGPLAPSPAPDRKSLLEHIRAVGRFYLDQRELGRLLELLRSECVELFNRRAPHAQGLDQAARLREAARLTGVRPRDLAQAFSAHADTPNDFSAAVRTLASFRRRLGQPLEDRS
jgi:hypothetical protein